MNTPGPGTQRMMYGNAGHTDVADCRTAGRSDFPNLRLSAKSEWQPRLWTLFLILSP